MIDRLCKEVRGNTLGTEDELYWRYGCCALGIAYGKRKRCSAATRAIRVIGANRAILAQTSCRSVGGAASWFVLRHHACAAPGAPAGARPVADSAGQPARVPTVRATVGTSPAVSSGLAHFTPRGPVVGIRCCGCHGFHSRSVRRRTARRRAVRCRAGPPPDAWHVTLALEANATEPVAHVSAML